MRRYTGRLSGVVWTAGSSLLVGVLGLLVLVVAARGLGAAAYTTFAVVWGLVYGLGGAYGGLQQEVTRSSATGRPGREATLMSVWALIMTLPVGVLGGIAAVTVLRLGPPTVGVIVAMGLVGMGMLTFVCGVLAAWSSWRAIAVLLVADASVRTIAVVLVVSAGRDDLVVAAVVSGLLAWSLLLPLPWYRRAVAQRLGDRPSRFTWLSLVGMTSAGCQALVVAGLPLLVALFVGGELAPETGAVMASAALIRSAFLLLLYGFRPMLLRHFLSNGRSAVVRACAGCGAAGAVYVLALWIFGPRALRLFLGSEYALSPALCSALALGTVGLGVMVVSGLALTAKGRALAGGVGWLSAVLATAAVVAMADSDRSAFVWAATLPPWVGVLVHGALLGGRTSRVRVRVAGAVRPR